MACHPSISGDLALDGLGQEGRIVTESLHNRMQHYVLDGSDRDLARLLLIAEVQAGNQPAPLSSGSET